MKYILFFLFAFAGGMTAQNNQALTEANFEKKRLEIAALSFDSDCLRQAKVLSDAYYLHTHQIDALLTLIRFESNRLDYAKYAYTTAVDTENYQRLVSHFSMSSYKKSFTDFLSKRSSIPINSDLANKESIQSDSKKSTTSSKSIPQKMQDQAFNAARESIELGSYESRKLKRMKQLVDVNYLLCSQLTELMQLLSFESSKLELALYAYPKAYDQVNYIELNNELKRQGSKTELTQFIAKQDIQDYSIDTASKTVLEPAKLPVESTIKAVSDEDFNQIFYLVQQQSSDSKKLVKAKNLTDRTLLSTKQVGRLVQIFVFENNRTAYLEYAFYRTTNPADYGQLTEFLEAESRPLIDQLLRQVGVDSSGNNLQGLALSQEDFAALVTKIKGLALESHKLERAQTTVDRSPLNTTQVAQINDLFRLEETKLSFAKYAFNHVVDPQNYQTVRNSLYKNASRFALDRYVKDQK
jgi:hypothetical protein